VFGALGWIPDRSTARLPDDGISWNYTTWLNILFLLLAAALVVRFVQTGGISMLRMMGGAPPADGEGHQHGGHDHGGHDHGDTPDHSDHTGHDHNGHGERHSQGPAEPGGRDAHHVAREEGD